MNLRERISNSLSTGILMSPDYSGLTLTVSPTTIELGEPVNFYGRFVWYEKGVANTKVSIEENGVHITDIYTDADGYFNKQWIPKTSGNKSYQAEATDPPIPPPSDPDEPTTPTPPPDEFEDKTTDDIDPKAKEPLSIRRIRNNLFQGQLFRGQRSQFFGMVSSFVNVLVNEPPEPEPEPEERIRIIDIILEKISEFGDR